MLDVSEVVYSCVIACGLGLLCLASLHDWVTRLVPNVIPVLLAFAGFIARLESGTVLPGLVAGLFVFGVAIAFWRFGCLGGADAKLFGAGALLVPPTAVLDFVLGSCLAGGILTIVYFALGCIVPPPRSGRLARTSQRCVRLAQWRLRRRGSLPYATAIAAGACCVLMKG